MPQTLVWLVYPTLMGLVSLPSYHDYWKKDEFLHYHLVAKRIPQDKFFDISRYLHFVNNSTILPPDNENYDRLCKMQPVIEYLCDKFQHVYDPDCDCSIDEAMVPYKGQCSKKQYIPQKPTKRGLNVWMRADSTNRYVSEFQIYVGKEKGSVESKLGERVIKDLTRKIKPKNYHVFCDNFFTSFSETY